MLRSLVNPGQGLLDRHLHKLTNMQTTNLDRQCFRSQPIPLAGAASAVVLIPLKLFPDPIGIRLAVSPLHIRNDALKRSRHLINAPAFVVAEVDLFLARPIKEDLLNVLRQVLPLGVSVKLVVLRDRLNRLQKIWAFPLPPRRQGPVINLQILIRHDQAFIEKQLDPKPITRRTSAKRCVERKQPRLNFGDSEPTDRASKILRKRNTLRVFILAHSGL